MSHIPRRTSEFQTSSVKKSVNPRPSRIATASSIASRFSNARVSSTPSGNRMTPAKTPTRSNSRDRQTMIPMTAEKEKAPVDDRALIQAKALQVLDELSRVDGYTDLVQKGLRSMTHKQFISILHLFLKPIVGDVKIDASNYVDYIHNTLLVLDYPYTINKSSLITPSAPHCQNSIIILLAWLSEFRAKERENEPLIDYVVNEDFTSPAMTEIFMKKTSEAFVFWNNQQEPEADDMQEQIRQMFIKQKIGGNGSIETDINRLKCEVDQLQREAKPLSLQMEYKNKREESKHLSERSTELHNVIEDLLSKIKSMKSELKSKQHDESKKSHELELMRAKISYQKLTTEDISRLLMEISEAKSVLASKKQASMELKEESSKKEIQLSNLIMKKLELIDRLNNYIYTLASDLEVAGMREDFDPSAYEIKSSKLGEVAAFDVELNQLKIGLKSLCDKYHHSMSSIDHEVAKLEGIKQTLSSEDGVKVKQIEILMVSLRTLDAEVNAVEQSLHGCMNNMEQVCQQNASEIRQLDEDIHDLRESIQQHNQLIDQITVDKEAFKVKSAKTCKMYLEKRKKEAAKARERLAAMKELVFKCNKMEAETNPPGLDEEIDRLLELQ